MKKNVFFKSGLILILLGIIVMSAEKTYAYIYDYNDDVNRSKEVIEYVDEGYNIFNKHAKDYKQALIKTYDSFSVFFDDFDKENITIISNINIVNNKLLDIKQVSINLYNYCEYDVGNNNTKSKCDVFRNNYKGIIESYDKLINSYNMIIDEYNRYAVERGKKTVPNYQYELDVEMNNIYSNM